MRLFYKSHCIAEVEEEDQDFPRCHGRFRLSPDLESIAEGKIKDYIDYSIATWPIIVAGRAVDIAFVDEEERVGSLTEPSDWWLENEGQRIPILIPIVCTEGTINWRLDPDRPTQGTPIAGRR